MNKRLALFVTAFVLLFALAPSYQPAATVLASARVAFTGLITMLANSVGLTVTF